jgi:hypothetical protein
MGFGLGAVKKTIVCCSFFNSQDLILSILEKREKKKISFHFSLSHAYVLRYRHNKFLQCEYALLFTSCEFLNH